MSGGRFGRYEVIEEVGRGGMGTVYRAHDPKMLREVAIKVLPADLAGVPGYAERFRREAYAAGRLSEPHVLSVYEADEVDGQLYLVMPFVEGSDLHQLLEREGQLSPQRAVHIIDQIAAALDAAAASGLIHRDVKPSNVLITNRDFAYLIDFGIAHDAAATKLTSTGTTMGTWGYMAPERFTTGTADQRGDVYSLACVLYECLTGALPFPGQSMPQQVHGHCYLEPPRPTAVNRALPAGLDAVVARGMAKDPNQRFASASELAAAARQAVAAPGGQPAAAGIPPPSSPMPQTMPARLYNEQLHRAQTQAAQPVDIPVGQASGNSAGHRGGVNKPLLIGGAAVLALLVAGAVLFKTATGPKGTDPGSPAVGNSCSRDIGGKLEKDPETGTALVCSGTTWRKAPILVGTHEQLESCTRQQLNDYATASNGYLLKCVDRGFNSSWGYYIWEAGHYE